MRRCRTAFVVGIAASFFLLPTSATAQDRSPVVGPVRAAPPESWAPVAPHASSGLQSVTIARADGDKDYTVAGLLIGTGVGLVAGYAFYDVICEAVNNRCSNSRLPLLMLGAGVGGSLGALLGSVTD